MQHSYSSLHCPICSLKWGMNDSVRRKREKHYSIQAASACLSFIFMKCCGSCKWNAAQQTQLPPTSTSHPFLLMAQHCTGRRILLTRYKQEVANKNHVKRSRELVFLTVWFTQFFTKMFEILHQKKTSEKIPQSHHTLNFIKRAFCACRQLIRKTLHDFHRMTCEISETFPREIQ